MRYRPQRLPCDTALRLVQGEGARPVRLVNLGPGGARLSGTGPLAPGEAVTLAHLGLQVAATVVWRRGGEAGVRFGRPLAPGEVAALRGAGTPAGWCGGATFREMG